MTTLDNNRDAEPEEKDADQVAAASADEVTPVFSTGLTARVADSYGADPHEHKPSQDPFDPNQPEKQAETGGVYVAEEDRWDGSNSSTSSSETESSDGKTDSDSTPAPTTESPSVKDPTGSSSARSTGTARKAQPPRAGN